MRCKTWAGRCIHQGFDEAKVYQNMNYRWLTLGSDALQTVIHRRHPERPILPYISPFTLAAQIIPGPSCLLGLGGAAAAHALNPYLNGFQLDAIEQSSDVIDIAHTYFMTSRIRHLNVIHQEAFSFLQHTTSRYQHLLVDLFNAHTFPTQCQNANFFEYCRNALMPEGVLAVNLANPDEQWPIFNWIRTHFQHSTITMPIHGTANLVVLAYRGASVNPLLSLLKENSRLKQLVWDAKWGYMAECHKMP
jgi:spermidine synthase